MFHVKGHVGHRVMWVTGSGLKVTWNKPKYLQVGSHQRQVAFFYFRVGRLGEIFFIQKFFLVQLFPLKNYLKTI